MLEGAYPDPVYERRRRDAFIVAINCTVAGGTCFCVSMDTGPRATSGYDLALTEVIDGGRHYFVADAGSERGERGARREVAHRGAAARRGRGGSAGVERAAASMGRELETDGIKELLYRNYEHPRWDEVSERCLTCGNCTMACPTCFCTTVEDVTDLTGETAERRREWDSCFTMDFSYVHGGSVRSSSRSRYRQWMTHKLATWIDQFGTSGCVGCGRCITWCPVAIDITEEAAAIRATDGLGTGEGDEDGESARDRRADRGRRSVRRAGPRLLELIAGCGSTTGFEAGDYPFREGEQADSFYVVRRGRIALEVFAPGRGQMILATLGPGELVGWSWLFPPYRWHFDGRAVEPVSGARLRRRLPARQVRRRPHARLRADEAIRVVDARPSPGDAAPAPRRLWQAGCLSEAHLGPWFRSRSGSWRRGATPRTPGRRSSSR